MSERAAHRGGTYPHAFKSGQGTQWSQSPQRPQGLDGSQLGVSQPVRCQADKGNLEGAAQGMRWKHN